MGTSTPKPFIELAGKTILQHSIEAFLEIQELIQIVVATSPEHIQEVRSMVATLPLSLAVHVVEGGKERQDSISNALQELSADVDMVAIHDAVRPFIRTEDIRNCLAVAQKSGACIVAIPVKDSIKKVSADNLITDTPKRADLWQAQTPQIFKVELIRDAYKFARDQGCVGTDDASIVEYFGEAVGIVEGDRQNFKITYPLDLKLAELLLDKA